MEAGEHELEHGLEIRPTTLATAKIFARIVDDEEPALE